MTERKEAVRALEYRGHKTMIDGTHVLMTKAEAAAIMKAIKTTDAKRARDMPTARDALTALIAAEQRMKDLGWWKGPGLHIKRGDECAVAETGSTGMWSGRLDSEGKYVHYGDCVSDPRKCWLKPLTDLSDDERVHMEVCDRREAEAYSAMLARAARPSGEGKQEVDGE